MGRVKRRSVALVGRDHFAQVLHLASRNHSRGVPANCSPQPTLSYDTLTCFHIYLAGSDTAEFPVPITQR